MTWEARPAASLPATLRESLNSFSRRCLSTLQGKVLLRTPGRLCSLGSGARAADKGHGGPRGDEGGAGASWLRTQRADPLHNREVSLRPRAKPRPRERIPGINPFRPPGRVHGGAGGAGVDPPARFAGRTLGASPRRSPPPALPAGPQAPAPPAPPPRALPAPRKRGPRRLGPGKGPRHWESARWVRPRGMSARRRPGYIGPREVRTRRDRAGAGRGGTARPGRTAGLGHRPGGTARGAASRERLSLSPFPSGVGARGDPGHAAWRGGLGLGMLELAEGAQWLPRLQRPRSLNPFPSPGHRGVCWDWVRGTDMCSLVLSALGPRSSCFWAGGWKGSGFDLRVLCFPKIDFPVL